jgi:glycosyltransferase involved in cell wall biosynthesis
LDDVVALVGPRSQEELPALYQRATVFAMPAVRASNGNGDALPTVLLEALARGLPVVASRLTSVTEIVDDGENGLLVAPGDVSELARALATLLAEPARHARFGIVGRAKAECCFDRARNAEPLGRLFARALGES